MSQMGSWKSEIKIWVLRPVPLTCRQPPSSHPLSLCAHPVSLPLLIGHQSDCIRAHLHSFI